MNFKKTKVAVASGLMAASMVLAPLAAYAEEVVDNNQPAHVESGEAGVKVEKTVQVAAEGVTLPENTKFSFTATFKASSNKENAREGAPATFNVELTGFVNATMLVKEGNIAAAADFAEAVPGEYVYSLKEDDTTKVDDNGTGWTCDTSEYVLRVYVDNAHKVKYTILKDDVYDLDVEGKNGLKLEKAAFSNIYTKNGGSEDQKAALVVSKKVEGDYGNKNQYFKFEVTFDTPDTYTLVDQSLNFNMTFDGNADGAYAGTDVATDGYSATTTDGIALTDGGRYTFYLKDGASVSFDKIPAGTKYTLKEYGYDGYTAAMTTMQNGANDLNATTGTLSNGVEKDEILIGEHENTATVTNTYKTITVTGVVTHSAPFVIMVGALFVAVGGYVVLKKRIEE